MTQSLAKKFPANKFANLKRVLIETDDFPFEFLSVLGQRESWRKEINRPIYHLHKWWAKRLGSVFRGILLGCIATPDSNLQDDFYSTHTSNGLSVFDPFMGSGTTVGEAHKLGFTALGRDINPVAAESVRVALGPLHAAKIEEFYRKLEQSVGERIRDLYRINSDREDMGEVLYFFWVQQVPCLHCEALIDLFRSRIIARNAYPDRKPEVQILCPQCECIFTGNVRESETKCPSCRLSFSPHEGAARKAQASCSSCGNMFKIVDVVRRRGRPPRHRLFAKLVLMPGGEKSYLPATESDLAEYRRCEKLLVEQLEEGNLRLPTLQLEQGHNTRQAMNYGYRSWRDFFNARQLLALGWLQQAIVAVEDSVSRDALLTVFSGALEFNNMFASYKGEGTGAVRHMFSHHILKPERTPIEANVWGTPKSSGSFSGLYRTRLRRAIQYREAPVEVALPSPLAAVNFRPQCSPPFSGEVSATWPPKQPWPQRSIYLSCGSSDMTELPTGSVDLVVTDPPFFDNVHYSELADFFLAWQCLYPRGYISSSKTSRSDKEVQDTRSDEFCEKLCEVFTECYRIMKDDGLLVFTYHHSRSEGWAALAAAVCGAGFSVINAHPVTSEMSVATPKSQAADPIQLDVVLVCRKRELDHRFRRNLKHVLAVTRERSFAKATRLRAAGFELSRNDRRVILYSQFLTEIGPFSSVALVVDRLTEAEPHLQSSLDAAEFFLPLVTNGNGCTGDQLLQKTLFD